MVLLAASWELLLDSEGLKWLINSWPGKLAPAFDICHSYRPDSEWVSQHSMSINGKRKDITRDDLLTMAKKMNIKKPDAIIDQVKDAISHWDIFASQTQVKTDLKNAIGKTLLLL